MAILVLEQVCAMQNYFNVLKINRKLGGERGAFSVVLVL